MARLDIAQVDEVVLVHVFLVRETSIHGRIRQLDGERRVRHVHFDAIHAVPE